jgi:6-pyruvoyltetrahydropterin/6-carboxytetrahydropterin synthase
MASFVPLKHHQNIVFMKHPLSLYRLGHFNAAHRLAIPSWSDEKNLEVFGKCANPNFHGHNYEVEVRVTGHVPADTGILINLKDLKVVIEREVEDRFDHKNLNLDCPEFKDLVPTVENICYIIYEILRVQIPEEFDLGIKLFETPRNYAEYPGRIGG